MALATAAAIDEALSRPLFNVSLVPLDYALAPPAILFGIPGCLFGSVVPLCVLAGTHQTLPDNRWATYCGYGVAYSALAFCDDVRLGSFSASWLSREPFYVTAMFVSTVYAGKCMRDGEERVSALLAMSFLTQQVNQLLKKAINRPRPTRSLLGGRSVDVRRWTVNEGDEVAGMPYDGESMPSGDAAQSASLCLGAWLLGAPAELCVVPALLSATGRVYFGCHFVGDVVAGAVQGAACTLLLHHVLPCGKGWGLRRLALSVGLYVLAEEGRKRVFGK